MSRDFIGSAQGRSFLKSANRDRVTRAGLPLYRSVILYSVKFGAFDGYLQAGGAVQYPTAVSGTRYRKVRHTVTWPGGARIDETDFGAGTSIVNRVIQADAPWESNTPWHPNVNVAVSPTRKEGGNATYKSVVELLDPEPQFAAGFGAETRGIFATEPFFRFQDFIRDVFTNLIYTRVYWTSGPYTYPTEADANSPDGYYVKTTTGRFGDAGFTTEPGLRRCGIGFGNIFDLSTPRWFGGTAGIFPGGSLNLSDQGAILPDMIQLAQLRAVAPRWICVLQRSQALIAQANEWIYSIPAGTDNADSFFEANKTQVRCTADAMIPGEILEPPEAGLLTEYTKTYHRRCYPPFRNTGLTVPDAPSCFTI